MERNVLAVVDDSGELLQQNDYYLFGYVMSSFGGSDNKYLYNGKELQEGTDWLDYGARMYSADLGRFMTVDRFAEKYLDLTPYQYVANKTLMDWKHKLKVTILKKINVSFGFTADPLAANRSTNARIDTYEWQQTRRLARITSARLSMNTRLDSKFFDELFGKINFK